MYKLYDCVLLLFQYDLGEYVNHSSTDNPHNID